MSSREKIILSIQSSFTSPYAVIKP